MECTDSRPRKFQWGECSDCSSIDPLPPDFVKMLQVRTDPKSESSYRPRHYQALCNGIEMNTADLIQHIKNMVALIKYEENRGQSNEVTSSLDLDPSKLPAQPDVYKRVTSNATELPFHFSSKEYSSRSDVRPVYPYTQESCRKILQKSVALLLAHTGFDYCPSDVLEVFTSVVEEYIIKLTKMIRISVDCENVNGSTGFPDVMEKVLHEIGAGNMEAIHKYYEKKVVKYNREAFALSTQLINEYEALTKIPEGTIVMDEIRIKEETDVPELHVPASEEGNDLGKLQPSLETGFQMLHSLEQGEELLKLEVEEEISVSDSPYQEVGSNPQEPAKKKKKKY